MTNYKANSKEIAPANESLNWRHQVNIDSFPYLTLKIFSIIDNSNWQFYSYSSKLSP